MFVSLPTGALVVLSLLVFSFQLVTGKREVVNENTLSSPASDAALIESVMQSVQLDLHQMKNALNFTERRVCHNDREEGNSSSSLSNLHSICWKAEILVELLDEAESIAAGLDNNVAYLSRRRSPQELTKIALQAVGIFGALIFLGYFIYYAVVCAFVTGVFLADVFIDLPQIFAKAMIIPYILIAVESVLYGYFLVGSFSVVASLGTFLASCLCSILHYPLILECMGIASIVVALYYLLILPPPSKTAQQKSEKSSKDHGFPH